MFSNHSDDRQLISLADLGWDAFFATHFQDFGIPDAIPARVISQSRESFRVYSQQGELIASMSGKMRYRGEETGYPAVGDWVAIRQVDGEQKAVILGLIPRKSRFSRKSAGEVTEEQIVAANVDIVFIVSGLDGGRNLNLRRIERYATLAWASGAIPVIVLNKADVCPDIQDCIREVEVIAPGIAVHAVSATKHVGLDQLSTYLTSGKTIAFLGSSGVGKSALINSLLGADRQKTGAVRGDDLSGRHTTTMRELFLVPGGGMVIDTPGMREIQMWGGEEDLGGSFPDIHALAEGCRFKDCSHKAETGCAVKLAIERGELDPARLESYHKLQNELSYLASREEDSTRLYEKLKWKKIAKQIKKLNKKS